MNASLQTSIFLCALLVAGCSTTTAPRTESQHLALEDREMRVYDLISQVCDYRAEVQYYDRALRELGAHNVAWYEWIYRNRKEKRSKIYDAALDTFIFKLEQEVAFLRRELADLSAGMAADDFGAGSQQDSPADGTRKSRR